MIFEQMVDAVAATFKQKLVEFGAERDWSTLTPERAERMLSGVKSAVAQAGVAASPGTGTPYTPREKSAAARKALRGQP